VKRLCADDSAATSVKVGYRQASYKGKPHQQAGGVFFVWCFFFFQIHQPHATAITLVSLPRF
jgi:hypothetical protein